MDIFHFISGYESHWIKGVTKYKNELKSVHKPPSTDRQKYDELHQSSMSDAPYARLMSAYAVATVSFVDDAVKIRNEDNNQAKIKEYVL